MAESILSQTAREYRMRYPDKPNMALARILYNENKPMFKSVEHARSIVRRIEGKNGRESLKWLKDKSLVVPPRPYNPYNIPQSDEIEYKPFKITGHKRLAVFSDIHLPYHSMSAINTAIRYCKKQKVDGLLLNGDVMDIHSLSRFERDPRKKDFATELSIMRQMLQSFQKHLKCKIYFKLGNHEERYEHFLMCRAGELVGVEEFEFQNIVKRRVPEVTVIGDKRIIHANKLNIIHGHEFGKAFLAPVNPARGLHLRAKTSAIQGHNHQSSEHNATDINGKPMTTWSTGALCELHPKYLPINNWNHGFAIVDLDPNGTDFHVRNLRIYNGEIL